MSLKAVLNINSDLALGKISYVSLGRDNLVVGSEIALNCSGLGG